MGKTTKLVDCLKVNDKMSEDAKMKVYMSALSEYHIDAMLASAGAQGVYNLNDGKDFQAIIQIYGHHLAVFFANRSEFGYCVAGRNITNPDDVVLINKANYKEVFDSFVPEIEDRIKNYYENEKFCWEDIQRYYPSIDIKKYLEGEKYVIWREEKRKNGAKEITCKTFPTYEEAIDYVNKCLEGLAVGRRNINIRINDNDSCYYFTDHNAGLEISFKFVD